VSETARREPYPYTIPGEFERGDVDTGDVRLTYWRHGRAQPLVVLHGVTDWGLDWARFARRVEGNLDCVLVDQRGHGYSDKPEGGYTNPQMAEDAWGVIQHLRLERPAVMGHSMGGGVALTLAAAHPEEIDRLLLVDPAVWLDTQRAARTRQPAEGRRAGLKERQALGRRALTGQVRASRPTWDAEDIANAVEGTLLVSPNVYSDERRTEPSDYEAQLRALRCPTLVVRGEPDRGAIISDESARRIRELVPNDLARVVQIAGTGHVPQREAFDLFVAVVLPFLTGDTSRADSRGGEPACFLHLLDENGVMRR
jgi:pimeloyl-ACP methyl ester carboxylesterase